MRIWVSEMNKTKEPKGQNAWRSFWSKEVASWLGERCRWGDQAVGHKTNAARLHEDFVAWCAARALPSVSIRLFGDILRERGILYAGKDGNGRVQRWPIRFMEAGELATAGADDAARGDLTRRVAALPANAVRAAFGARAS